jgi:hypothetical protein
MNKFGSLAPADKPHRVYIKLDGKQIIDNDGKPFFIDIYAEDSAVGRRFDKQQREQALDNARNGIDQPSQIDINIAKCAALTAGWHLVDPDTLDPILEEETGEPIRCTLENAKELYSLPLTTWIWPQPWAAANNHVNFIKRSARNSLPTQSGISAMAAE